MTPNEDVIPAVQSLLHVLLSHEQSVTIGTLPCFVPKPEPYFFLYSSHVRRRALLAIRALSRHNPELLTRLHGKVIKILRDSDEKVVKAALTVATGMSTVRRLLSGLAMSDRILNKDAAIAPKVRTAVNDILSESSYIGEPGQWFISKVLSCLNTVGYVAHLTLILASLILTGSP
jgi:AP-4 complex subunit epsilon-1